jgi:hypothetical protein
VIVNVINKFASFFNIYEKENTSIDFPVEDITSDSGDELKLTIELVPSSCWSSNVRSNINKTDWDILRKQCYKNAGYKCEICGGRGDKHPVEAHEIWKYDDSKKIQKLERLIALCPSCHLVKHFGFAQTKGKGDYAFKHFCRVNLIDPSDAERYIDAAFEKWNKRSVEEWDLDISWLDKMGIKYKVTIPCQQVKVRA